MGRRSGGEGPPAWIWLVLVGFVFVVWLIAQIGVAIHMARMRRRELAAAAQDRTTAGETTGAGTKKGN